MPWIWQGRRKRCSWPTSCEDKSGEGVWTPSTHWTAEAGRKNTGNSLEVKLGCLGQGSCTTASIQGLHRGDFSLRPIHQGLARYFGGFSAQLQIIAMVTDASHDNFVTSETRNSCLKKQASSRNSDIYFPFFFIIFFCWLHSVLGVLSGFLMDEASIIWTVKNVSVHQVKVIFSYIIFLPLTRNAVYFWRKKKFSVPVILGETKGLFSSLISISL